MTNEQALKEIKIAAAMNHLLLLNKSTDYTKAQKTEMAIALGQRLPEYAEAIERIAMSEKEIELNSLN